MTPTFHSPGNYRFNVFHSAPCVRVGSNAFAPLDRWHARRYRHDEPGRSHRSRRARRASIGLSNGFRFAPPIAPGPITEGDLWNILPLDARMKKGWVTGHELRAYLERELELVLSPDPWKLSGGWGPRASGLQMLFAAKAPAGLRVQQVTIDGALLRDNSRYTLAGCERAGEPLDMICRLQGVHDPEVLPTSIHQALRQYLAKHPVIAPKREGRARATDLPSVIFSQDGILLGGH